MLRGAMIILVDIIVIAEATFAGPQACLIWQDLSSARRGAAEGSQLSASVS